VSLAATPVRRVDAPRKRVAHDRALRPAPPRPKKPELRLVPRPRTAANAVIILVTMIAALMLAAVVLHTRLAERQLEIDRLEQEVVSARERFDVLRQQRAELRSPGRLTIESAELGMSPSPGTEFLEVDSATLAQVLAAAGTANDVIGEVESPDPLDQIRRVRQAERS
jgi:cell division protein FtsL